ncbi:MAG: hypothetical protein ACI4R8_03230 [Candidatus Caccovivens sp.]
MNNEFFKKFITDSKKDNRILYDPEFFGKYEDLLHTIHQDVQKFDIFTLSGKFQDILIKVTNNFVFDIKENYYKRFLDLIYLEFEQLVVPNIVLIPLNNLKLNLNNKDYFEIAENIRIYTPTNIEYSKLKPFKEGVIKKDKLSEYFEQNVYARLLKEHIILAKDHYFFNNPIMTVLIRNVDFKVEHEASRITEAVYSFIRMIDFDSDMEDFGWGVLNGLKQPASTYGVYYNSPNKSSKPPYDNGYGHSFIFKFEPILDINSSEFFERIERFKFLINKFVSYCFINRTQFSDSELKQLDKWMNAVLLYNSAYELASKEKYDVTIITLLTILESLFLKNTGNKKMLLAEELSNFLQEKKFKYNKQKIIDLIVETYNHRSKFVHEGKLYDISSYKSINDRQGTIPGMKPFAYGMFASVSHDDAKSIYLLFKITGYVIMAYFD